MNLATLSLMEMQQLIGQLAMSGLQYAPELICAVQNEMAERHLEALDWEPNGAMVYTLSSLEQVPYTTLRDWVDQFTAGSLPVPQVLISAMYRKQQKEANELLIKQFNSWKTNGNF